jgi:hypothetical protein
MLDGRHGKKETGDGRKGDRRRIGKETYQGSGIGCDETGYALLTILRVVPLCFLRSPFLPSPVSFFTIDSEWT